LTVVRSGEVHRRLPWVQMRDGWLSPNQ
jgi:hypothetical protein